LRHKGDKPVSCLICGIYLPNVRKSLNTFVLAMSPKGKT
jgi:hypothetical protein